MKWPPAQCPARDGLPLDQPMQTRGEIQMSHALFFFQHCRIALAQFLEACAAALNAARAKTGAVR